MITINGQVIQKDIFQILNEVKSENPNKLAVIQKSGDENIQVTCPVHANGQESHPSCFISINPNKKIPYGTVHCFTCGFNGSFSKFVGACFDRSEAYGKNWLLNKYANVLIKDHLNLQPIDLSANIISKPKVLDESILDTFESYHPYMTKRGISEGIIKLFNLKYDQKRKSIVFPVYNINGKLSFLTRRSVEGKQFYLDPGADKNIIYGLDKAQNYSEVYVVESQINCLVLWSWGYPAVCLFGAGTTPGQLNVLRNSSIKSFVLCYDGDEAGRKGANRFKKYIGSSKFVTDIIMPTGKDVADLTKEEFEKLSLQTKNNMLLF